MILALVQDAKTSQPRFPSRNFCVAAGVLSQTSPRQAQKQARLFFGERALIKSANPGLNARVTPGGTPVVCHKSHHTWRRDLKVSDADATYPVVRQKVWLTLESARYAAEAA
jgi:hypothetical protein